MTPDCRRSSVLRIAIWLSSKTPKRHNACICPLENAGFLDASTSLNVTCVKTEGRKKRFKRCGSTAVRADRAMFHVCRKPLAGSVLQRDVKSSRQVFQAIELAKAPASATEFDSGFVGLHARAHAQLPATTRFASACALIDSSAALPATTAIHPDSAAAALRLWRTPRALVEFDRHEPGN